MIPPPERRDGPPPLSRVRMIAAAAIILVAAAVASYAVGERQRAARLAGEIARLHEVVRLLDDSLAAQRARLDSLARARPATAPPPPQRP